MSLPLLRNWPECICWFVSLYTKWILHSKHWLKFYFALSVGQLYFHNLLGFIGVVDMLIYELPVFNCYVQETLPGYEVLTGKRASRLAAHLAHLTVNNGDQGREEGTATRLFCSVSLMLIKIQNSLFCLFHKAL